MTRCQHQDTDCEFCHARRRYVDGLATFTPADVSIYDQMGQRMAQEGHVRPAIVGARDAYASADVITV